MRLVLPFLTALAVFAASAPASVTTVSALQLSQGTVIDVEGTDFARPVRAWLEAGRRKIPLRVGRGASTTGFRAILARHPARAAGEYELVVRSSVSRIPFHYAGLTIEKPKPTGVTPFTAAPGEVVTIDGSYFGVRRGIVKVGTVRARVHSWTDTQITFVVPPRGPRGLAYVTVANRAGAAEAPPTLTVEE